MNVLTKFITLGIVSIMSFFGFSKNEYSFLLPQEKQPTPEQNISQTINNSSTTPQTPTAQLQNNFIPPKKPEPETEPKTNTNPTKKIIPKTSTSSPAQKIVPINIAPATSTLAQNISPVQNSQNIGNQISASASVNEKISAAVINIYCQAVRGPYIETITGSGVEIDPSGVYLTNAHVAMYVMLSDVKPPGVISCYIREGGPAKKIYEAKTVYVPSNWIYSHPSAYSIGTELTGTGEGDYAIIKRGNSNPNFSKDQFPPEWSAPIALSMPTINQNIILSGYPVYDQSIVSSALYPLTNSSTILNSFSLNGNASALFDSASTKLAKIGSSGGGAFDSGGNLFGIMDAEIQNTPGELPSERIIGINYIKNDILKNTGKNFENIVANAESESQNFIKNVAPTLSKVLTSGK